RMADRHPEIVAAYPSYKAAKLLKAIPGLPLLRRLMRRAAGTEALPVAARAFSLRLYRAALYADAV
ncbi:MAG: glycosyltransferase family 2 protein, partial [Brevundimonas sp.]